MKDPFTEEEVKLQNFLKDAFCIDGKVEKVKSGKYKQLLKTLEIQKEGIYKLTDSKRGKFYIALIVEN